MWVWFKEGLMTTPLSQLAADLFFLVGLPALSVLILGWVVAGFQKPD